MIDFSCSGCGQSFSVPDYAAGRSVKCKNCGAQLTVPPPSRAGLAAQPAAGVTPMRLRRLRADAEEMHRAFDGFDAIRIESAGGNPPDQYVIEYRVRGLEKVGAEPVPRVAHRVEVQLVSEYPRLPPKCRMLTPIFHPNIDPATICVGDHWTAGERLVDLVIRIAEMIAYQDYNIQSPLNAEAAMWADLHAKELPLESRDLRPPEA